MAATWAAMTKRVCEFNYSPLSLRAVLAQFKTRMFALMALRIFAGVLLAGLNGDLNKRQRSVGAIISYFKIRHGILLCGNVDAPID